MDKQSVQSALHHFLHTTAGVVIGGMDVADKICGLLRVAAVGIVTDHPVQDTLEGGGAAAVSDVRHGGEYTLQFVSVYPQGGMR